MKAFTTDTIEYQTFFEIWNYFKKYAKIEKAIDWQEMIQEGNGIVEKFKTSLAKDLVLCCIEEMNRRKEKS